MSVIDLIYYEYLYMSLIDLIYYLNVNFDSCIITNKLHKILLPKTINTNLVIIFCSRKTKPINNNLLIVHINILKCLTPTTQTYECIVRAHMNSSLSSV